MTANEVAELRRYAARVLAGTGIAVDDVDAVLAGTDESAAAVALRAGWQSALTEKGGEPR